ncbi:MAG: hypothetical protein J6C77_05860 [Muribaculaceae bacterium]|nr:hypothetical protein [Muribaculaceae bacterium]
MDITSDNINDIKGRAIKPWESCGLNAEDCVQISADNLINITSKLDTFIPDNNLTVWGVVAYTIKANRRWWCRF